MIQKTFLFIIIFACQLQAAPKEELIQLAQRIQYLNYGEVIYGRGFEGDIHFQKNIKGEYVTFIKTIEKLTIDDLKLITKHPSAKVRLFALLGLYSKQNHKATLETAATLFDDQNEVQPHPIWGPSLNFYPVKKYSKKNKPVSLRKQTVGSIAKRIYHFYLDHSNYRSDTPFESYWKDHENLITCTSWIGIEILFATGGSSIEIQFEKERFKKIKKKLYLIQDRRERILAYLCNLGRNYSIILRQVEKEEILKLLKELKHSDCLDILKGHVKAKDSYTKQFFNPSNSIVKFILLHAKHLLKKEDIPFLIKQHQESFEVPKTRIPRMAEWTIAIYLLNPNLSIDYLHQHLKQIQNDPNMSYYSINESRLLGFKWKTFRLQEIDSIISWFYNKRDNSESARGYFLAYIHKHIQSKDNKTLIKRLITHPKFKQLELGTLYHFSKIIHKLGDKKIIAYRYPLDTSNFDLSNLENASYFYSPIDQKPRTMNQWQNKFLDWAKH